MSTRTIVTSQPDVACDVCARRLLRGEQPDFFIADGQRRLVCELCAPRATHEGWLRETEAAADVTLPPMRPRRGRSLLDRLIGARGTEDTGASEDTSGSRERVPRGTSQPEGSYDLFASGPDAHEDEAEPAQPPVESLPPAAAHLVHAVDAFNASEYPRRVAGVARSLGEPVVSVRSAEHLESVVRIVVAWELCWYRYEVDTGEQPLFAQAIGQGTELEQLSRDEREGNAVAAPSGALALAQ
jgi:hypothetical protein